MIKDIVIREIKKEKMKEGFYITISQENLVLHGKLYQNGTKMQQSNHTKYNTSMACNFMKQKV